MRSRAILPLAVMTLTFGLAGCGGGGNIGDLVDTVTGLIPDTKKPLPGERRAVFPEGVPGVPQGVPPELVKGYQQESAPAAPPEPAPEPAKKPVAKPKQTKAKSGAPQSITPGEDADANAAPPE